MIEVCGPARHGSTLILGDMELRGRQHSVADLTCSWLRAGEGPQRPGTDRHQDRRAELNPQSPFRRAGRLSRASVSQPATGHATKTKSTTSSNAITIAA